MDDCELDEDGLYSFTSRLKDFDDANVPVDIWFEELDEAHECWKNGFRFCLRCGNYMPRKGRVEEAAVEVYAKDRETLQKAVAKYIVPFYEVALAKVKKIAEQGKGELYYWDKD